MWFDVTGPVCNCGYYRWINSDVWFAASRWDQVSAVTKASLLLLVVGQNATIKVLYHMYGHPLDGWVVVVHSDGWWAVTGLIVVTMVDLATGVVNGDVGRRWMLWGWG